jgi:hypothetical protein
LKLVDRWTRWLNYENLEVDMGNLIQFTGECEVEGKQICFHVEISSPERDGPLGDYVCRVRSPQLFTKCMDIFGVSRHQAVELALNIVAASLTAKVVRDTDSGDDCEGDGVDD